MGTRADFYVGTGKDAEWLGSIAWDGYKWAEDKDSAIATAKTEANFRQSVLDMFKERDDVTTPNMGWPWPWDNSRMTDYTYYFKNDCVSCEERSDWPDMSDKKNVQIGGKRSGIIVVGL